VDNLGRTVLGFRYEAVHLLWILPIVFERGDVVESSVHGERHGVVLSLTLIILAQKSGNELWVQFDIHVSVRVRVTRQKQEQE
jgi:hypothetical protein